MLNNETKRRIDTARDILVGKVPDPKSQVEQITIALIYKFMDDMDAEAEELGGKRKFFTENFARYGWAKLMSAGIGGHELIGLYGEGISSMPNNAGIPSLFRGIFKNAYLPYRDPETLKSFLKVIDEFSYNDSESLGDAFEYLLSVLGSQGDAGQFRTPRHIIDFIVEIVAPKKGEVVLDPACGTAGFLISSYKHILRENVDAKNISTLTPDDKGRLAVNFKGYDISPDMVRLSLVNMYLHGFTDPHVFEYDTLTSEERWNEFADVILANPPFMSPKGGIKPHKRFSIQAKRSEVLFVDYIAEHLTPTGRAGIIVPEGIIFQSQSAYKDLRKMLVENSLIAVISLPAGVFNPYSGVKTSILILDKSLAKQCNTIAFFKIENDGFSLGAQRRANAGGQLSQIKAELTEYFHALHNQQQINNFKPLFGLIVPKGMIASNGYNLSGESYRERNTTLTTFEFRAVGEITDEIKAGFASGQSSVNTKGVPHIRPMNITEKGQFTWDGVKQIESSEFAGKEHYMLKVGDVLFNNTNSKELVGKTCLIEENIQGGFSNHMTRIRTNPALCIPHFLALLLHNAWQKGIFLQLSNKWVGQAGINAKSLSLFQIPLPPLEVQKEIVAEIDSYQKVIDGARAVIDNYRPHIPINPDWPTIELGQLCKIEHGFAFKGEFFVKKASGDIPILLTPGNFVQGGGLYFTENNTKRYTGNIPDAFRLQRGDLVIVMTDLSPMMKILGMPAIIDSDQLLHNQRIGKVVLKSNQVLKTFLHYAFLIERVNDQIKREATGSTVRHTSPSRILSVEIPFPPITIQQAIVTEIEAEQNLIASNHELIARFEKKIQTTLARMWGEENNEIITDTIREMELNTND